jgi:hypothetical protein
MSKPFEVTPTAAPVLLARGWQRQAALTLFVLALLSPTLASLVLVSSLDEGVRRPLAGLLLSGLPMALMLVVVAMIGQPAYRYLNKPLSGGDSGNGTVSVIRYRIGLVLVVLAVLVSWIEPLVSPHVPAMAARRVLIGTVADAAVLVSLFVLGGEFWDKVHALFVHDARVLPDPDAKPSEVDAVLVGWRFYIGSTLLLCSSCAWMPVPIVSWAGWSGAQIARLTGVLFIGSKVGQITAIAIMGKAGFNHARRIVFRFLRRFGPARRVSRGRYRLGLVLFLIPFFMTWLAPYITGIVRPGSIYGFLQSASLEALLLVGLFVLGGEFWDKVGALFRPHARVEIPPRGH